MQRPIQNLRCMSALVICSALSACIPTVRSPVSNIPQSAAPPPSLPVDLVTQMEPEPVWNARQVVPNARTIPERSNIVRSGEIIIAAHYSEPALRFVNGEMLCAQGLHRDWPVSRKQHPSELRTAAPPTCRSGYPNGARAGLERKSGRTERPNQSGKQL